MTVVIVSLAALACNTCQTQFTDANGERLFPFASDAIDAATAAGWSTAGWVDATWRSRRPYGYLTCPACNTSSSAPAGDPA